VQKLRLNQYHCITDKSGTKYKVNYHESLGQMTSSLEIFNRVLVEKKQEREAFQKMNADLVLDIKHA